MQFALWKVLAKERHRVTDAAAEVEDLARGEALLAHQRSKVGNLVLGEVFGAFAGDRHVRLVLVVVFVGQKIEFSTKALVAGFVRAGLIVHSTLAFSRNSSAADNSGEETTS